MEPVFQYIDCLALSNMPEQGLESVQFEPNYLQICSRLRKSSGQLAFDPILPFYAYGVSGRDNPFASQV